MGEAIGAEAIYDGLGEVLARWTMGAAAAPVATAWRGEIGDDAPEAELWLLALSGHFLATSVGTAPPGDLHALPDIPRLALQALPDDLRPLARRILRGMKESQPRRSLLAFLVGRGWTLHPEDWMPAAGDEHAPDVYAPWHDWADAAASAMPKSRAAAETLTVETWPDYGTAARNVVLAALRRRDPAAAVALLTAKFGGEGAEARLRLLGLMTTGLSEADRVFLEGIVATDRAPKVKALAGSLLARMGHGSAGSEDAKELAGFFELGTKGLLRRARVVKAQALKTPAQHNRRRQLFSCVDLADFAAALTLSPQDLAASWTWQDDFHVDAQFAEMLERSAPESVIAEVCAQLRDVGPAGSATVMALRPRLDALQRTAFVRQMLRGGASFLAALEIARGDCEIDGVMDGPAGSALLKALAAANATPASQAAELQALGLLATREAAQKAKDRLQTIGVLGADPRLDMLRLNAALPKGTI